MTVNNILRGVYQMSSVHGMPDDQYKPDELSPAPNREQQSVYRSMIGSNLKMIFVLGI